MEIINNSNNTETPQLPPLQAPPETQIITPINIIEVKKPKLKITNLVKYLISFYLVIIIPFLLLILFSSFVDTSGFMGGLAVVGYFFIYGNIIATVASIITIIFTKKFINSNFEKNENKFVNIYFIFKLCLLIISFSLFIEIVQKILYLSISSTEITIYLHYFLFLIYPLFIPFCSFFLKRENLNKKTIYLSIFASFLIQNIIFPVLIQIINNVSFKIIITSIFSSFSLSGLFSIVSLISPCNTFILALLPFLVISLIKLKRNDENNTSRQSSLLQISIALLIITALSVGINFIPKKNYLSSKIESNQEHSYCIETYMVSNNYLFYSGSIENNCNSDDGLSYGLKNDKAIIKLDLITKKTTSLATTVKEIYYFDDDKNNLYFTYESRGPLYQMDTNGKITKIISSKNPSIKNLFNNYLYYIDYSDNRAFKRINIITKKIDKLNTVMKYPIIIYADNDYLYLGDEGTNDVYRTNFNFSENTLLKTTNSIFFKYQHLENQLIDNKIYLFNDHKLYIYNLDSLNYDYVTPNNTNINNLNVIGIKDNLLYLYENNSFEQKNIIYYLDLNNLQNGFIPLTNDSIKNQKYDPKNMEYVKIIENYIYYMNYSDNGNLYRINLNSQEKEKITDVGNCKLIDIKDNSIYYIKLNINNNLNNIYRINIDTSINEKLI